MTELVIFALILLSFTPPGVALANRLFPYVLHIHYDEFNGLKFALERKTEADR